MNFYDFSYLPLCKLRLITSQCIFYNFTVCYFLVCMSLPKSQLSSKFRLDFSSTSGPMQALKCTFPNFMSKDIMEIIEYN